ncbi:hypothetical protein J2S51_005504 [Streptomyces sp. DSM 41269]|nr:hypothetical protein [Streptomyces sp. DSM 41269]
MTWTLSVGIDVLPGPSPAAQPVEHAAGPL